MAYQTKPIFAGQEEPIVVPQPSPSPATRFATMQRIMPAETQTQIYDSVFGPEPTPAETREARFQDWINSRKQAIEQQRTDDVRMARINALGNVLTTMVQPLGWAIGGKGTGVTGGVQPVDNRQYLQAFERAVKANDDLRNIGTLEGEYQFKLAEDEARRAQALEDFEQKQAINLETQRRIFDMRSQLSQQQMEERIKVAEATAKAKFQFSTRGGGKVAESVRDNLLKRANTAYAQILADYYKKKEIGIENLQEPPSYDEFLKKFASENGYAVAESQNAKEPKQEPTAPPSPTTTPSGKKANPMGGVTPSSASGKKKNPMS